MGERRLKIADYALVEYFYWSYNFLRSNKVSDLKDPVCGELVV